MRWLFAGALSALAGCVSAPVFKDIAPAPMAPADVSLDPERYHDAEVVWGGKIVDVRNLETTTEVQIIGYPLDEAQRPVFGAPTVGRFVLSLPGFVEPMDFPFAHFVTLRGRIVGTETKPIDDHDDVFPVVGDATVHLWPIEFPYDQSHWSFGVGVGVGVH